MYACVKRVMRGDKCLVKSRSVLSSLAIGSHFFFFLLYVIAGFKNKSLSSTPPHASTPSAVHPGNNYLLLAICYRREL